MNTTFNSQVDVQMASTAADIPAEADFEDWAVAALDTLGVAGQLCVRIVDEAEMTGLNESYRGRQGPTNVLSFPFAATEHISPPLLGDIVICAPVVAREAGDQHKISRAHYAHMLVHGTLHLLDYDHETDAQAQQMETLEIQILTGFGMPDPYATQNVHE